MNDLPALPAEARQKLQRYFDVLMEENEKFNLTAVRERSEAYDRHIVESASLLPQLGAAKSLIDVGTGGGLPGMVLAICRPDIDVTLLEATGKKARFLETVARELQLDSVSVVCERAETAAREGNEHREHFDLVTARAVAPLRTLLELTVPFAKPGGRVLAVKGQKAREEIRAAERALRVLGCEISQVLRNAAGSLVIVEKHSPTPGRYPRRSGEPKRSPL